MAEGEAGGITQHVAAYKVSTGENDVVFMDTPGHAAFTAMRARGASVTDIVVLIVAADDGPMPQTEESISHARAAGVPIVVAINKCDKPETDPERIKQELTQFELVPEEWGGDTMFVPIRRSLAKASMTCWKPRAPLKSSNSKRIQRNKHLVLSLGPDGEGSRSVITILVQEGTLKKGDFIVAGTNYGRVRALLNDTGDNLKEAGPPLRWRSSAWVDYLLPVILSVVKNEKDAKRVIASREEKSREAAKPTSRVTQWSFSQPLVSQRRRSKTSFSSGRRWVYEAIKVALEQLATDEVETRLLHGVARYNPILTWPRHLMRL